MTHSRFNEIKNTLTDKKWNEAELAFHCERMVPELIEFAAKGTFEPEAAPAEKSAPVESQPAPVEPEAEPEAEIAEATPAEPAEPAESDEE